MKTRIHPASVGLLLAVASTAPLGAQDFRPAGTFTANTYDAGTCYRRDFNNNGIDDGVMVTFSRALVLVDPSLSMTNATFTEVANTVGFGGGVLDGTFFADFDSDGNEDIGLEVLGVFNRARFAYVPGDGLGGFGAPVTVAIAATKTGQMTAGDFNGDGQVDLAFWDFPTGASPTMRIFEQNQGTYTPVHTYTSTSLLFPAGLVAGDFDGDGDDDVCWFEAGTMYTLLGTNAGYAAPSTRAVAAELNAGFTADLDHDGFEDLAAFSAGPNGWRVDVFWGEAANLLGAPQNVVALPAPTRSDYLGPFDVDSNGEVELLATIRNQSGYWLIRHDGARGFSPAPYVTTMGGWLLDLDGDRDLDMFTISSFSGPYGLEENLARYGSACGGVAGAPELAVGSAIPGATLDLALENAAPNSLAQIFLSFGGIAPGPCGPQIDYGRLLFPNPATFLWSATDGAGRLAHSFAIPANAPTGPYTLQGVVLDPQGMFNVLGLGIAATGGRALRVY